MREVLLILLLFALTLGRCAVTVTVLQPTIDGVAHAWVRAETATDPIDDLACFRQAERDGRADSKGKHGKPGQRYLAWRLPNSYNGPHIPLGWDAAGSGISIANWQTCDVTGTQGTAVCLKMRFAGGVIRQMGHWRGAVCGGSRMRWFTGGDMGRVGLLSGICWRLRWVVDNGRLPSPVAGSCPCYWGNELNEKE
ncbi:MAG: hypothetical protein R6X34_13930 [Chloroflexota bacterium]